MRIRAFYVVISLFIAIFNINSAFASQPLSAIKEGWGWPVIVISPKGGWNTPEGISTKTAISMAEREISVTHEGVYGRDIVFLYSDAKGVKDLERLLPDWRAMKAAIILDFSDNNEMTAWLIQKCAVNGPSLVVCGGEAFRLRNAQNRAHTYLFALDFYRNYRANAFAELTRAEDKGYAVLSDPYAVILARGARLTAELIKRRKINISNMWMMSQGDRQLGIRISEAYAGGADTVISWLDGIGTLSFWRALKDYKYPMKLWHAGDFDPLIKQAAGTIFIAQDAALDNQKEALRKTSLKISSQTSVIVPDVVASAKAYALARWAITGFVDAKTDEPYAVAQALSRAKGIPLLDDILSINPATHRPYQRRVAALRITGQGGYFFERYITINSQAVAD